MLRAGSMLFITTLPDGRLCSLGRYMTGLNQLYPHTKVPFCPHTSTVMLLSFC